MNAVTELHHKAMEMADEGVIARVKFGDLETARAFYEKAFLLEKRAVSQMPLDGDKPVPRPVMIRSVAALAYKAGLFQEAEKMIAFGLSENPPAYVEEELRHLSATIQKEKSASTENGHFEITGVLTQADATESEITVEDARRKQPYSIFVPKNQLAEIVKKYWQDKVNVQATSTPHGVILLETIRRAA